jgi:hypothetical protein
MTNTQFSMLNFQFRLLLVLPALCSPMVVFGQAKHEPPPSPPLSPAEAKIQGHALAAEMLAEQPGQNTTNVGALVTRAADGKKRSLPMRFKVIVTPTNWLSVYEAGGASTNSGGERLVVTHAENQPNVYELSGGDAGAIGASAKTLAYAELMRPFANSDFRVGDLGLEFFHWPEQRLLKREMRRGQSCEVLESVNPNPVPGGYARVVSWLDAESPHGIVHAEAYDSRGELLEQFDPKKLEKVQGQWQPEELEIRNRQTGSRTLIQYNLND